MGEEFDALQYNGTWTLNPHPTHKMVVHNKWVYKLKQKSNGTIDRYKARLVAKGFDQEKGVDYTETFSPVVKPTTVRLILAIVVHFNWPIRQLDVFFFMEFLKMKFIWSNRKVSLIPLIRTMYVGSIKLFMG